MPDFMKEEFTKLYLRFEKLFPGTINKGEIFLFRVCIANKPPIKTFRIPVDKIRTLG